MKLIKLLLLFYIFFLFSCTEKKKELSQYQYNTNKETVVRKTQLNIDDYLPENSKIAKIQKFNKVNGNIIDEVHAILSIDIDNDSHNEIIVACDIEQEDILYSFILIIDKNNNGYFKK